MQLGNILGFPGDASGKEPACSCWGLRDAGLIPALRRSPGEGHGNPLQYSSLENPMDKGAWWATVHKVAKSWTWLKQLSMHAQVIYSLKFSCYGIWTLQGTTIIHKYILFKIYVWKARGKKIAFYILTLLAQAYKVKWNFHNWNSRLNKYNLTLLNRQVSWKALKMIVFPSENLESFC